MNLCHVASELAPLAKTGGLGDVVAALGRALHQRGHDVRVFLPFYSRIDTTGLSVVPVDFLPEVPVRLGERRLAFRGFTTRLPGSDLAVYLIDCPPLYHRGGIYDAAGDEHLRFAFLTRAALECCQRMGFAPQVLHCHDWHAALGPLYLKTTYAWDRLFARTRSVLTIHNVGYPGTFPRRVLEELGLAGEAARFHQEDLALGRVSFLATGILHADLLTTVSPTHAREIQTPEYGMGLDPLLRARASSLVGILNGVDHGEWDPRVDPWLSFHYSGEDLDGKRKSKRVLLEGLALPHGDEVPTLGVVTRLVYQKGIDLMLDPLPRFLESRDLRLVALGSGEARYENYFQWLQLRFPGKVVYYRGFQNELAHLIEAGADIFLMPSRYEPCGLNQMYSLRYGTPPVVRRTGGLADTVQHWDPASGTGTGFLFEHPTPDGFAWGLEQALAAYRDREGWRRLMRNGMAQDFSWERQIGRYEELYRRLAA